MEIYLIVSNDKSWRVRWNRIDLPPGKHCILLADKVSCEKILAGEGARFFQEIIPFSPFKHEEVYLHIRSQVDRYKDLAKIHVVTINEDDLMFCAKVRHEFGLEGESIQEIERFTNKIMMKQVLKAHPGFHEYLPKYITFNSAKYSNNPADYIRKVTTRLGERLVMRPIDQSDSREVAFVDSKEEFEVWAKCHEAKPARYEVDERIFGKLYHCDSIVIEGDVVFSVTSEYLHPCAEMKREQKYHGSIVLPPDDPISQRVGDFNLRVIRQLEPQEGCVTHLEVFITHTGKLIFLEVAERVGGCTIDDLLFRYCGINLREVDYILRLGLPWRMPDAVPRHPCMRLDITGNDIPRALHELLSPTSRIEILYHEPEVSHNNLHLLIENPNYALLRRDFERLRKYSNGLGLQASPAISALAFGIASHAISPESFCLEEKPVDTGVLKEAAADF